VVVVVVVVDVVDVVLAAACDAVVTRGAVVADTRAVVVGTTVDPVRAESTGVEALGAVAPADAAGAVVVTAGVVVATGAGVVVGADDALLLPDPSVVVVALAVVVGAAVVVVAAVVVGAAVVVVAAVDVVAGPAIWNAIVALPDPPPDPDAWMVTFADPPEAGVPVIAPVDVLRTRPVGRLPPDTAYVTVPEMFEGVRAGAERLTPAVPLIETASGVIEPPTLPAHPRELMRSLRNAFAAVVSASSGAPFVVENEKTRPLLPAGTQPAIPTPRSVAFVDGSAAAGMFATFEFQRAQ